MPTFLFNIFVQILLIFFYSWTCLTLYISNLCEHIYTIYIYIYIYIINLLTFSDFTGFLFGYQTQTDAIYFDLSSIFDLLLRNFWTVWLLWWLVSQLHKDRTISVPWMLYIYLYFSLAHCGWPGCTNEIVIIA
jgi:hypothetical protein